jgi:AcrR family transcriptional regulator
LNLLDNGLTRKESITQTAIEIINEIGIQGFSIRELAKRQGITEAAIYRHYESKQDILLSVINIFENFVFQVIHQIDSSTFESRDKIIFFIKSHTTFFEQNPSMTSIVLSEEIFRNDNIIAAKIKEMFDLRTRYFIRLIEEGRSQGIIPDLFTNQEFADIILGLLRRLTTRWRMSGYEFPLEDNVLSTLAKLLQIS